MTRALLAVLLLAGCPSPVAFVTAHAIEVARPAPPPDAALVEAWTEELLATWAASPCPEVRALDARAGLRRAFAEGLPVRLYWRARPMSTGRMIAASERTAYQHELAHALLDGYRLASWGDDPHHRLMCRCRLPIAATVCAGLEAP